jgi:hypothetical protein
VREVSDAQGCEEALAHAASTNGPHFVVVELEGEDIRDAGQSRAYPFIVESAIRFRRTLEDRGLVPTIWAV